MKALNGAAVLLTVLISLAACAGISGRNYLFRSDEVRDMFENNNVPESYTYYYTGPEAEPVAILGISDEFTLDAEYWYQVLLTDEQLRDWNRKIANDRRVRIIYKGWRIMAPDGRQAGILYTKYEFISVSFPDRNTISITPPEPTGTQRMYMRENISH